MDKKLEDLLDKEDFKLLNAYCKERLSVYADKNEYLFYHAVALFGLGKYETSGNIFHKLFKKTGEYFYLICKSFAEYSSGDRGQAQTDLEEAIENDESVEDLLLAFDIARTSQDFNDAKKALKKALKLEPRKTSAKIEAIFERFKDAAESDRLLMVSVMQLLKVIQEE